MGELKIRSKGESATEQGPIEPILTEQSQIRDKWMEETDPKYQRDPE